MRDKKTNSDHKLVKNRKIILSFMMGLIPTDGTKLFPDEFIIDDRDFTEII